MTITLSTGQDYNPVAKEKLKTIFKSDTYKTAGKNALSKVSSTLGKGLKEGSGLALDLFIGDWAGDWFREKMEPKKDSEKSLKFKDYISIIKAEIGSLLDRKTEQLKPEVPKEEPKSETPIKKEVAEGLERLGVFGQSDLEELISEMRKTSEEELLKYIEDNQINDSKLINDLIEAVHSANNEVENGLRKQFKKEHPSSKALERIANSTESMEKILAKDAQDIYKSESPQARIEQRTEEKKEEKSPLFGLLSAIPGTLGKIGATISGAIASVGAALGTIGKVIPGLGGIASTVGGGAKALAGLATRALPVAAVAGAGFLGYEVGKVINSTLEKNNISVGGAVYDAVDWFKGSSVGNMLGMKSDQQKMDSVEPKVQTIHKPSVQQQQAKTLTASSEELTKSKEERSSTPIVVNAPTNVSGGKSGTSEVLNYTSQNTDNTFRRLNDKSFQFSFI